MPHTAYPHDAFHRAYDEAATFALLLGGRVTSIALKGFYRARVRFAGKRSAAFEAPSAAEAMGLLAAWLRPRAEARHREVVTMFDRRNDDPTDAAPTGGGGAR